MLTIRPAAACTFKARLIPERCGSCWSRCWHDRISRPRPHLDRGRSDGSAARLHGSERDCADPPEQDPFAGHLFLFRSRRGGLIKGLWWDGDGICLFAKRLERGRFLWPQVVDGSVPLSRAQLSMLLEGIGRRRPARTAAPQMAV